MNTTFGYKECAHDSSNREPILTLTTATTTTCAACVAPLHAPSNRVSTSKRQPRRSRSRLLLASRGVLLLLLSCHLPHGAAQVTHAEAQCIVQGKSLVMFGDSITRYCYFGFNYWLEEGVLPSAEYSSSWGNYDQDYDKGEKWTSSGPLSGSSKHLQWCYKDFDDIGTRTDFYFVQGVWYDSLAELIGNVENYDIVVFNTGWWQLKDDGDRYCGIEWTDECESSYKSDLNELQQNLFVQSADRVNVWRTTTCCGENADEETTWIDGIEKQNVAARQALGSSVGYAEAYDLFGFNELDTATFDGNHPNLEYCLRINLRILAAIDEQQGKTCTGGGGGSDNGGGDGGNDNGGSDGGNDNDGGNGGNDNDGGDGGNDNDSGGSAYHPTYTPTILPTSRSSAQPSLKPSGEPTRKPSDLPLSRPTLAPTLRPTQSPSWRPTVPPTLKPSWRPTVLPTPKPSWRPTVTPTRKPSWRPTVPPTPKPSWRPTVLPSPRPTWLPTGGHSTGSTTVYPSAFAIPQSLQPSPSPSLSPILGPTSTPDCIRNATWFKKGSPDKDCLWAEEHEPRCDAKGEDGSLAVEACCGVCSKETTSIAPTMKGPPSAAPTAAAPSFAPTEAPSNLVLISAVPVPVPTSIPSTFAPSAPVPTPLPSLIPSTAYPTFPTPRPTDAPSTPVPSMPLPQATPTIAPSSLPPTFTPSSPLSTPAPSAMRRAALAVTSVVALFAEDVSESEAWSSAVGSAVVAVSPSLVSVINVTIAQYPQARRRLLDEETMLVFTVVANALLAQDLSALTATASVKSELMSAITDGSLEAAILETAPTDAYRGLVVTASAQLVDNVTLVYSDSFVAEPTAVPVSTAVPSTVMPVSSTGMPVSSTVMPVSSTNMPVMSTGAPSVMSRTPGDSRTPSPTANDKNNKKSSKDAAVIAIYVLVPFFILSMIVACVVLYASWKQGSPERIEVEQQDFLEDEAHKVKEEYARKQRRPEERRKDPGTMTEGSGDLYKLDGNRDAGPRTSARDFKGKTFKKPSPLHVDDTHPSSRSPGQGQLASAGIYRARQPAVDSRIPARLESGDALETRLLSDAATHRTTRKEEQRPVASSSNEERNKHVTRTPRSSAAHKSRKSSPSLSSPVSTLSSGDRSRQQLRQHTPPRDRRDSSRDDGSGIRQPKSAPRLYVAPDLEAEI